MGILTSEWFSLKHSDKTMAFRQEKEEETFGA